VSNQDVKIESARDVQTASSLDERMQQCFIVQDQVPGIFVRQKFDEAAAVSILHPAQKDEFDVLGGKLCPAIGLINFIDCLRKPSMSACLRLSANQLTIFCRLQGSIEQELFHATPSHPRDRHKNYQKRTVGR
jgi:hypothetical protein